ncbi:hypothetical protein BD779DRAFT_1569365 [Infundibulicybe gibba]|nr:hypothetical protein BD779DRAFT_1569365 [Infundibulicybe gibba]
MDELLTLSWFVWIGVGNACCNEPICHPRADFPGDARSPILTGPNITPPIHVGPTNLGVRPATPGTRMCRDPSISVPISAYQCEIRRHLKIDVVYAALRATFCLPSLININCFLP